MLLGGLDFTGFRRALLISSITASAWCRCTGAKYITGDTRLGRPDL